MAPLWNSTPEKLPFVGPRSSSPSPGGMGGMAGILDEISATSSKTSSNQQSPYGSSYKSSGTAPLYNQQSSGNSYTSTAKLPLYDQQSSYGTSFASSSKPPLYGQQPSGSSYTSSIKASLYGQQPSYSSSYTSSIKTPLYSQQSSGNSYSSSIKTPLYSQQSAGHSYPASSNTSLYNQQTSYGNSYASASKIPSYGPNYELPHNPDEMEWSPIIKQKQNISFKPRQLQTQPQQSENPASAQPSPFYGRIPEAPYSPAHRLRNPPNQARLRVSSQEVKENFFKHITRRGSDPKSSSDADENTTKREMNLAQQRFFPPTPPSEAEAGNVLADLLTSFSSTLR